MKTNLKSPKLNIPGVDCKFYFRVSVTLPMVYTTNDYRYSLSLTIHHSRGENLDNVWVMSSSFSLLNPLTGSAETSSLRNNVKMEDMSWSNVFYKSGIVKSCLHGGALSFQVTATVLLLGSPVESVVQIPPAVGFCEKVKDMHKKKLFTDMQIVVQDKTFNVHRAVLAAHSPVFEKMFENDMKENLEKKIEVSDLDPDVVEDLVEFMYSGSVKNVKSCHKQLFLVADKLKKNITPSNVVEYLSLARMMPSQVSKSLKECCVLILKLNKATIYKSKEWKQLKESSPEFVIEIMEELTL